MRLRKNVLPILGIALMTFLMNSCTKADKKTPSQKTSRLKFEISFPSAAHPEPITGRVYVIIAKEEKLGGPVEYAIQGKEPRLQTGWGHPTGIPFWGKNVYALMPGDPAVIDEEVFGYPPKSISEIEPGEYNVQGFVDVVEIRNFKLWKLANNDKTNKLDLIIMGRKNPIEFFTDTVKKLEEISSVILYGTPDREGGNILLIGENIDSNEVKAATAKTKERFSFTVNTLVLTEEQFDQMNKMGLYPQTKKVIYSR